MQTQKRRSASRSMAAAARADGVCRRKILSQISLCMHPARVWGVRGNHFARTGQPWACPGHPRLLRDRTEESHSKQFLVQVLPFGVHPMNEAHLPCSRPMLDLFFALNSASNVVMIFVINKHLQFISLCETFHQAFTMLISSSRQVARYAHVEHSVASIGRYVNPPAH